MLLHLTLSVSISHCVCLFQCSAKKIKIMSNIIINWVFFSDMIIFVIAIIIIMFMKKRNNIDVPFYGCLFLLLSLSLSLCRPASLSLSFSLSVSVYLFILSWFYTSLSSSIFFIRFAALSSSAILLFWFLTSSSVGFCTYFGGLSTFWFFFSGKTVNSIFKFSFHFAVLSLKDCSSLWGDELTFLYVGGGGGLYFGFWHYRWLIQLLSALICTLSLYTYQRYHPAVS